MLPLNHQALRTTKEGKGEENNPHSMRDSFQEEIAWIILLVTASIPMLDLTATIPAKVGE